MSEGNQQNLFSVRFLVFIKYKIFKKQLPFELYIVKLIYKISKLSKNHH